MQYVERFVYEHQRIELQELSVDGVMPKDSVYSTREGEDAQLDWGEG